MGRCERAIFWYRGNNSDAYSKSEKVEVSLLSLMKKTKSNINQDK